MDIGQISLTSVNSASICVYVLSTVAFVAYVIYTCCCMGSDDDENLIFNTRQVFALAMSLILCNICM